MKVRLNKRTIDEATYEGPGGCYLWDTEIAGFGLRIYPTGRKAFLITYRSGGRQRFYTLGRFGELTVQQARAEALETLGRARKGEDPSGDRRSARRVSSVNYFCRSATIIFAGQRSPFRGPSRRPTTARF